MYCEKVNVISTKGMDKIVCITSKGIIYSNWSYLHGKRYFLIDHGTNKRTKLKFSDKLKKCIKRSIKYNNEIILVVREFNNTVIGGFLGYGTYNDECFILFQLNLKKKTFYIIDELKGVYRYIDRQYIQMVPKIVGMIGDNIYMGNTNYFSNTRLEHIDMVNPEVVYYNKTTRLIAKVNFDTYQENNDRNIITVQKLMISKKIGHDVFYEKKNIKIDDMDVTNSQYITNVLPMSKIKIEHVLYNTYTCETKFVDYSHENYIPKYNNDVIILRDEICFITNDGMVKYKNLDIPENIIFCFIEQNNGDIIMITENKKIFNVYKIYNC